MASFLSIPWDRYRSICSAIVISSKLCFFLVLCIFAYLFNYATIVYSNIHNSLSYVPRFIMCFLYKFIFRADFYTNSC